MPRTRANKKQAQPQKEAKQPQSKAPRKADLEQELKELRATLAAQAQGPKAQHLDEKDDKGREGKVVHDGHDMNKPPSAEDLHRDLQRPQAQHDADLLERKKQDELRISELNSKLTELQARLNSPRDTGNAQETIRVAPSDLRELLHENRRTKHYTAQYDSTGRISLVDWLSLFERATAHLGDDLKIKAVQHHVKCPEVLGRILSATLAESSTWAGFKQVILGGVVTEAEESWETVKQLDTETVEDYWTRFQAGLRECQSLVSGFAADEARKLRVFERGLLQPIRGAMAVRQDFRTAAALKTAAAHFSRKNTPMGTTAPQVHNLELHTHQRSAPVNACGTPELLQRLALLHPEVKAAVADEAKSYDRPVLELFAVLEAKGGVCHACGEHGHWKDKCPRKQQAKPADAQQAPKRKHWTSHGSSQGPCPRHPHGTHSSEECNYACPLHPHAAHKRSECTSRPADVRQASDNKNKKSRREVVCREDDSARGPGSDSRTHPSRRGGRSF